jgi:hypothetical protein
MSVAPPRDVWRTLDLRGLSVRETPPGLLEERDMATDRPDPLDRIIELSRPQQGAPPSELNDPRNYLVFDRLPSAAALAKGTTVFTTDRDGARPSAIPAPCWA